MESGTAFVRIEVEQDSPEVKNYGFNAFDRAVQVQSIVHEYLAILQEELRQFARSKAVRKGSGHA